MMCRLTYQEREGAGGCHIVCIRVPYIFNTPSCGFERGGHFEFRPRLLCLSVFYGPSGKQRAAVIENRKRVILLLQKDGWTHISVFLVSGGKRTTHHHNFLSISQAEHRRLQMHRKRQPLPSLRAISLRKYSDKMRGDVW